MSAAVTSGKLWRDRSAAIIRDGSVAVLETLFNTCNAVLVAAHCMDDESSRLSKMCLFMIALLRRVFTFSNAV